MLIVVEVVRKGQKIQNSKMHKSSSNSKPDQAVRGLDNSFCSVKLLERVLFVT